MKVFRAHRVPGAYRFIRRDGTMITGLSGRLIEIDGEPASIVGATEGEEEVEVPDGPVLDATIPLFTVSDAEIMIREKRCVSVRIERIGYYVIWSEPEITEFLRVKSEHQMDGDAIFVFIMVEASRRLRRAQRETR